MSNIRTFGPLPAPERSDLPRYSTRELPPYRFVPGVNPHPVRDAAGHSHSSKPTSIQKRSWNPAHWPRLEPWLHGVDLFNRFYFWEAHEAWEELWATAQKDAAPALFLQGLIQVAAALLKIHMKVPEGARALSAAGVEKLRRAGAEHQTLFGIRIEPTVREFEAYFAPLASGQLPRIDVKVPVLRLRRDEDFSESE